MIKKYITGIAIVVVALLLLGLLGNIEAKEDLVINFPKSADFTNEAQGGVQFDFNFPQDSFKVGEEEADFLMFLNSETIPGLSVGYDTKRKKLIAGLPMIESEEIDLLNGQSHQLVYTFNKDIKYHAIYLDGEIVAEGVYTGDSGISLTGFAVSSNRKIIDSDYKIITTFE